MGDDEPMIKKGTIVRRMPDDFCANVRGIRHRVLLNSYPPENEICIVTSKPKETDLSNHTSFKKTNIISLKKAIELIYNGKWYGPCDLYAFEEVKNRD